MLRSVFGKTLWERRTSLVWWVVGAAALAAWIVAFYPALRDSAELQTFIEDFPPELLALFGIDPAVYTTGFGYLQAQLYTLIAPLLLIALCIGMGASATAREEEDKTMDLLLATPTSRSRVILEKFLAMAVAAGLVAATMALVLIIADPIVDLRLSPAGIVAINVGVLLLGLLFGTLAMAIAAWRGSRGLAAGVAAAAAISAWFVNGFAPLVDWVGAIDPYLPFSWYLAEDPLLNGAPWQYLLLAGAGLALMVATVALFARRDIGVKLPLITLPESLRRKPSNAAGPGRADWLLGSVYGKTLWERRHSLWWWLLGLGLLAALTAAFWPTIETGGDSMQALLDAVPAELLAMFGVTDPAALITPEGFLSARLYSSVGTIVVLVFTIGMGAATVAGEEHSGVLDLLLGTPTRRSVIARDKLMGMITLVAFLVTGLFVVVIISGFVFDMGLDVLNVAAANAGMGLLCLFFGSLAFAIGAGTGRPGAAIGLATGAAVAAFLLNGFGAVVEGLEPFRWLSPFFWYLQDSPPLARGFSATYLLLVAGVVLLGALAVPLFRKRDVAV